MKKLACALVVIVYAVCGPMTRGAVSFSAGLNIGSTADFYDPLSSYGSWVSVGSYGRCWHPSEVARDWRPYTVGHWEWTDVGWYWVSDEPWAWACYHYGSWVFDPSYGWIWVPGTEWAPAWVNWRESDDYIGWAPCGPGGVVLDASFFVFTGVRHFHDRFRPSSFVFNDRRIYNSTRRVGSFRRETRDIEGTRQRVVYNPGPSVTTVQKATGQRFEPIPIREAVSSTPLPQSVRRRDAFSGAQRGAETIRPDQRNFDNQRTYDRRNSTTRPEAQPTVPPSEAPRQNAVPQVPPTGREPRVYRQEVQPKSAPLPQAPPKNRSIQPQQPATPPPSAPVVPERPPTATGRERGYENRPETPAPTPPSRIERPQNPTGRERGNSAPPPSQAAPREVPRSHPSPPAEGDRGRERDKDKDHP